MHSIIRSLPLRALLLQEAPALGASLLVAELFYKFHSFTLECLAFLATWYALSGAAAFFVGRSGAPGRDPERETGRW